MNLYFYDDIDVGYMKDYVYKILKRNIMELRLKPGIALRKEKIAQKMNVSITPIREAFSRLSEDGLVEIYPQKGTYVSHINHEKVEQAKFMREYLERAIVRLACNKFTEDFFFKIQLNVKMQEIYAEQEDFIQLYKMDNDFHKILFEGCNKGDLWLSIQQVSTHLDRMRILSLSANFNRKEVITDHLDIIEALKDKNVDYAEKIMKRHIDRISFDIKKLKHEYIDYFK